MASKEGRGGVVHLDIFPRNIGKVVPVDAPVPGDLLENLPQLTKLVNGVTREERKNWLDIITKYGIFNNLLMVLDGKKTIHFLLERAKSIILTTS